MENKTPVFVFCVFSLYHHLSSQGIVQQSAPGKLNTFVEITIFRELRSFPAHGQPVTEALDSSN